MSVQIDSQNCRAAQRICRDAAASPFFGQNESFLRADNRSELEFIP